MPLSLKTNHHNDETRQPLLQQEQPQSPRTIPKNRQQLRASPPELEQDKEPELVLPVEQEPERPIEGDLEVPLVDQELEQQGRKSLLGRPYWKRAVSRGLRVRKEQGIRDSRNNIDTGNNNNHHNRLRREGGYSDGDDPTSLPQSQNDYSISSASHPTNHRLNQPMTMTSMPIKDNDDSNEGQQNVGKNTFGLSLDANQKDVIASIERVLIHIGLLVLAYSCGVHSPGAFPVVRRLAEYLVVAWLTCRSILLLSYWNHFRNNNNNNRALVESMSISSATEIPPSPPSLIQRRAHLVDVDEYDHDDDGMDGDRGSQNQTPALVPDPSLPQPHPSLEHLFIMNTSNGQRFFPNSTETFVLDNFLFKGQMLSMIRTPDVDHPLEDAAARGPAPGHSQQQLYASYFAQNNAGLNFNGNSN
ncbi:hypothetical protein MHU86_12227 [Fragilaria crotonensis]|nr:hypothetical protein MHU86_12227 [Fragilaria crotonensis]